MPDWLATTSPELQTTVATLAARLLVAWLCGWLVAYLARRKLPAGTADTLTLTLVLMSILIAMATQIIGDNIARAFSLVGALSIVRFRTAVPATRDVAFVLAAVVVGMAIGAGQYIVTGLGLATVFLATQFSSPKGIHGGAQDGSPLECGSGVWRLTLQVGLAAGGTWEVELERATASFQLLSVETTRRGAAMELVYRYLPRADHDAIQIISTLNALPSVESAAVKHM